MWQFLNNPWTIGIGGGVLSGLFVTLITRYLFSRRENREYLQKIITANHEILYAIRPGISEGIIPSQDVIDALIAATAQKYGVDVRDLYNSSEISDVLIKEVMDSSFLSAAAKSEFCERLAQLKPKVSPKKIISEPSELPKRISEISDYRRKMVTMMSMMLGLVAGLMTVIVSLTDLKNLDILLPTLLTILAAFFVTYISWMFRIIERKKKERSIEIDNSKDDLNENA